jgi:hypothetical protein
MAAGGVRKAAGAFFGLIFGGAVSSEAASFFWRLACQRALSRHALEQ